jgi:hypothetical protein
MFESLGPQLSTHSPKERAMCVLVKLLTATLLPNGLYTLGPVGRKRHTPRHAAQGETWFTHRIVYGGQTKKEYTRCSKRRRRRKIGTGSRVASVDVVNHGAARGVEPIAHVRERGLRAREKKQINAVRTSCRRPRYHGGGIGEFFIRNSQRAPTLMQPSWKLQSFWQPASSLTKSMPCVDT